MEPHLFTAVREAIRSATGQDLGPACETRSVGGGCIHQAFQLGDNPSFFVKVNRASHADLFTAEEEALRAIDATGCIRVPRSITSGISGDSSFLVMEYVSMKGGTAKSWALMGEQLASLHHCTSPDGQFGWPNANYIGATPQPNARHAGWIHFFREERLGHQLKLASEKGARFEDSDRLLDGLDAFFTDYTPLPSLLHGDLWSGNAAFTESDTPVIFDPASYYGDRECDLAFTTLFGGFPRAFYEAYDAAWPRHPGRHSREPLYNLYHVLNHFNLFGGSYRSQAQQIIRSLNALV